MWQAAGSEAADDPDDTQAVRLTASDVGKRVVVRHRIPDGRATDVLGELLAVTDDHLTVRDRVGLAHVVAIADVVAAKPVPPPPVRPDRPEPGSAGTD